MLDVLDGILRGRLSLALLPDQLYRRWFQRGRGGGAGGEPATILMVLPVHSLAIFLFTTHMIRHNAIGHCGVELFAARGDGRPLIGWITTVTHHDLHHVEPRWNMGLYFTWRAWIGGTEHPQYRAELAHVARQVVPQRITGAI